MDPAPLEHSGSTASVWLVGRENRWAALYDPSRASGIRGPREFGQDNANIALQHARWLTAGEVEDRSRIKPGTGAVVRRGLLRNLDPAAMRSSNR